MIQRQLWATRIFDATFVYVATCGGFSMKIPEDYHRKIKNTDYLANYLVRMTKQEGRDNFVSWDFSPLSLPTGKIRRLTKCHESRSLYQSFFFPHFNTCSPRMRLNEWLALGWSSSQVLLFVTCCLHDPRLKFSRNQSSLGLNIPSEHSAHEPVALGLVLAAAKCTGLMWEECMQMCDEPVGATPPFWVHFTATIIQTYVFIRPLRISQFSKKKKRLVWQWLWSKVEILPFTFLLFLPFNLQFARCCFLEFASSLLTRNNLLLSHCVNKCADVMF